MTWRCRYGNNMYKKSDRNEIVLAVTDTGQLQSTDGRTVNVTR